MLRTFNIVGYINKIKLNNQMWCFINMQLVAYWAPLNLWCCLLHFAMPCLIKPDMHHTWLCIMPCLFDGWFTMLLASFGVASLVSFGFVPELWGSVRLRLVVLFMDSFFLLAGSQARWPYPRNHFYLCLLVVRSIAMPRYLPLAISCLPYCHVKPLTHLS